MELGIISLQMIIKIKPKTRAEIKSQMSVEIEGAEEFLQDDLCFY